MPEIIRRVVPLNIKAAGKDDMTFEGYGSVFGVVDCYDDEVMPGAFALSLNKSRETGKWPKLLWQHDSRVPLGVYTEMREDSQGLFVRGKFSQTTMAMEVRQLLLDGAIDGLSIGFITTDSDFGADGRRRIKGVDLWEVSIVTFPANQAAGITSVKTRPGSVRELEQSLHDLGYSRTEAKAIASQGYKALGRDAQGDENGQRDADEAKTCIAGLTNILKG